MECLDVSLHISWWSEGFSTRITFVIFLTFMKCLYMILQTSWINEALSTRVTFVISWAFLMIIFQMQSQLTFFPKYSVTHIACKNFHLSMDISNVLVFALIRWKRFFTNFTFEFVLWLILRCFHIENQTNTQIESKNYYLIASYNFPTLIFKILCFLHFFTKISWLKSPNPINKAINPLETGKTSRGFCSHCYWALGFF